MQLDPLIFRLIADASQYTSVVKGAEVDLKNLAGAVSGVERAEAALARARAASASVSSRQNDLAAQAIDAQKLAQEQTKAASAAKLLADNRLAAANATGNVDKITAAQRAVARAEIEGIRAAAAERKSQGLLSGLVGSQGQIAEQAERNLNSARLNLARANLNRVGVLEKAIVDSSSEAHRRGSEVAWSYWNTFWGRMLGAAAIFGLTGGIAGAAKTAVELAVDYERAAVSFEVMAGSAEKGRAVLEGINKLAVESPFRSSELVKEAKQLAAFSFKDDQIIPTLRVLGDVASGTGVDMGRLSLALGQVNVIGRLMGQELRQFTNAGVPLIKYLALAMGEAEDRIPQLVRQGMVGFNDVAKAMNLMTKEGGLFHGMMKRINEETVYGRWQNFVETLEITGRRLAGAAMNALGVRDALSSLTAVFQGVTDQSAADFFQTLVGSFGMVRYAVVQTVSYVEEFVSGFVDYFGEITESVTDSIPGWESLSFGVKAVGLSIGLFVGAMTAASVGLVAYNAAIWAVTGSYRLLHIQVIAVTAAKVLYRGVLWSITAATAASAAVTWTVTTAMAAYSSVLAAFTTQAGLTRIAINLTSLAMLAWAGYFKVLTSATIAYNAVLRALFTVKGLGELFSGTVSVLSTLAGLIGPLGVAVVVVTGLVALLHSLGAFDGVLDTLFSGKWNDVFGDMKTSFKTLIDLVKEGEFQNAFELLAKQVVVIWDTLLIHMEAAWAKFSFNIQSGLALSIGKSMVGMTDMLGPLGFLVSPAQKGAAEVLRSKVETWEKNKNNPAAVQEVMDSILGQVDSLESRKALNELSGRRRTELNLSRDLRSIFRDLNIMDSVTVPPNWVAKDSDVSYKNISSRPDLPYLPDALSPDVMNRARRVKDLMSRNEFIESRLNDPSIFNPPDAVAYFQEMIEDNKKVIEDLGGDRELDRLKKAAEVESLQNNVISSHEKVIKSLQDYAAAVKMGNRVSVDTTLKAAEEAMGRYKEARKKLENELKEVSENFGISILPKVGADTLKYIQDMEREMIKTGEPFEQFIKHLGMVKEAVEGPKGALAAAAALGVNPAALVWKGIIDEMEAGELRFREYEKLRNAVAKNNQDKVAPSALAGSSAAQDIINRNQLIVKGTQEEILDVLREANRMSQEANTRRQQIVDKLNQLVSEDSPLVTGTFKGR